MRDKIFVGSHESIACTGGIREARYRCTQSKRFDGIHLYGPSGMKAYTNSVMEILKGAEVIPKDCPPCPQFQHQNRMSGSGVSQAGQCYSWVQDRDIRRKKPRSVANQNRFSGSTTYGQKQFRSRANYNKYEVLSNQGNY